MRKALRYLPFAAAATLPLAGCFSDSTPRTAGVDDFPNSVYASVSGFAGESQQADAAQALPAGAQSLLETGALPAAKPGANGNAAAKVAASGDTVFAVDSSTMGQGFVTYTASVTTADQITFDTAQVIWDEKARDTIKDNENIMHWVHYVVWFTGKTERVEATDADGDGLVSPVPGHLNKVRVRITDNDSGLTSQGDLVAGLGPDNNLTQDSDNVYYAMRWWKTHGGDTLAMAEYSRPDGDSDSVIVDNAMPSVAILDYREFHPAAKPHTAESHLRLTTRTHYHAAAEVLGISGEEKLVDGGSNQVALLNARGGSELNLNDTVLARFTTHGAPGDTLDSMQVESRMNLGGTFDQKDDDRTYGFQVSVAKRLGEEKGGTFSFHSDDPMIPDAKPANGSVSLELDYVDGTSLSLSGTFHAGALAADVVDRKGKRFHAEWDAEGKLISAEAL